MRRTKREKLIFSLLGVVLVNLVIFISPARADFFDFLDPIENFKKGMREWFSELATSFATAAFEYLGDFILSTTALEKVPNLETLVSWSQMAGGCLVSFFFIKRVVEGLRDNLTGEGEPNFAEILGSTVVASALVVATPTIVRMFISLNNMIVSGLTSSLSINVNIAGSEILDKYTASGDLALANLHVIFMLLVWAIAFLVFSIIGALRYVELAILLVMGPISASAYVNRSSAYATYWQEAISVIFTQVAHVILAYWTIQWSSAGTFWGLISSIASAFIALRGPQVLRTYLYSSGTGSMITGVSRIAMYKAMMPRFS
jgi:hypothetical protein